jgi:hypothetical protein
MAYRDGRPLRRGQDDLSEVRPGDKVVHVVCNDAPAR